MKRTTACRFIEQQYLLPGDKHLNQKDAEENDRGTSYVVLKDGQVNGSVL